MSQNPTDGYDPNDPFGTWRTMRDANLETWAKSMTSMVNTDVFAKAIGLQLDTLLAASAPVQKAVQQYMESYLAQANMPSRGEVVSLATRLTHIEMRLDDLQAQLDDVLGAIRALAVAPLAAASDAEPVNGESKPTARGGRPRKATNE
jgi:hypothetical protein